MLNSWAKNFSLLHFFSPKGLCLATFFTFVLISPINLYDFGIGLQSPSPSLPHPAVDADISRCRKYPHRLPVMYKELQHTRTTTATMLSPYLCTNPLHLAGCGMRSHAKRCVPVERRAGENKFHLGTHLETEQGWFEAKQ